jgi:hypothetical protein
MANLVENSGVEHVEKTALPDPPGKLTYARQAGRAKRIDRDAKRFIRVIRYASDQGPCSRNRWE